VLLVLVDVRRGSPTEGDDAARARRRQLAPGAHPARRRARRAQPRAATGRIIYFTDVHFSAEPASVRRGRLPWDYAARDVWESPEAEMKLLVTGGAGFIGSNFIRHVLTAHPDDSRRQPRQADVRRQPGEPRRPRHDPRYTFVHGDICDAKLVRDVVPGVDAVVNFAARVHVDRSILDPDAFPAHRRPRAFTRSWRRSASCASRAPAHHTDEVYGSIARGLRCEAARWRPTNPYSAAKAAAICSCSRTRTRTACPSSSRAPRTTSGRTSIPRRSSRCSSPTRSTTQPLPLYGDGRQVRDWLYVLDNCAAIDLVLRRGRDGRGLQHRRRPRGREPRAHPRDPEIHGQAGDPDPSREGSPGHDRRYSVDARKVRALGWAPRQPFAEALAATVEWYRRHEAWWRPLKSGEFKAYYQQQYAGR
jgi:dTDP-glucose 4,6-dehydratase